MKHAVYLFCRRSVPGLFVKVSRAVGVSVFADLTGRNVPERCTQCMGYRTPTGCRSNRKVAVADRALNFVGTAEPESVPEWLQILTPSGSGAWKCPYLQAERWAKVLTLPSPFRDLPIQKPTGWHPRHHSILPDEPLRPLQNPHPSFVEISRCIHSSAQGTPSPRAWL